MNQTAATRKAALWVGVVFLLGAALGGLLGYVFAHRSYAASAAPMSDLARRTEKVQRMTQELGLTPVQSQQLGEIIKQIQGEYRSIRQKTEPEIDQARQRGRERIREILTPEQKPKFEEYMKRLDEERKRNALHP